MIDEISQIAENDKRIEITTVNRKVNTTTEEIMCESDVESKIIEKRYKELEKAHTMSDRDLCNARI